MSNPQLSRDPLPHELEAVEDEDLVEDGEVEEAADGSAVIKLPGQTAEAQRKHFANIVEEVDKFDLSRTVATLLENIEIDKESRSKRDELYTEGIRRTGLGDDAPGGAQFTGANKVVHPMLAEACVDFCARTMKEIMPPGGPAKSKVVGKRDKAKLDKAQRKTDFLNWQTTEDMSEFRGELEQLATQMPLGGSQFLKMYWDPERMRPVSEFVPIDDVFIPFSATNYYTAERKTHVIKLTREKYARLVKAKVYRDADLGHAEEPVRTKTEKANDRVEGKEENNYNEDGTRTFYEVLLRLDIETEGEFSPYILTIDKTSQVPVGLYRNWDPEDDLRTELEWTVEFPFVPWRGAYSIGLTHLIGTLSGAATGALRALMDSAHIQNMPTLLKLKGGPAGQTLNMQPTQVQDVDGGAVTDDIRKLLMPIPFNPPSPVLFQLLGFLIDAGRGVVQTSFEKLSDASPNQPVGTTVALIEQGMVVFSSIHARLHNAMSRVLKILHRINKSYLTEEVLHQRVPDMEISPEDFDGPMDVIPVTDPNIFSETQRFAQVQALLQRSATMPTMYDARKVEEMFLRAMKIEEDVLIPKPGEEDVDPVSENVAMALGRPAYVLPKQEHLAHIDVHMAFMRSPMLGANPVIEKKALLPMVEHLVQHVLNYYLVESHAVVEDGVKENAIEDGNTEQEVKAILKVQEFIEQQFGKMELAQILPAMDQAAMKYMPPPPQDPSKEIANINAGVQKEALAQRAQSDQQRLQADQQKNVLQLQDKRDERDAKLKMTELQAQQERERQAMQIEHDRRAEEMRQQHEDQRAAEDNQTRTDINAADNQTAIYISDKRLEAGEGNNLSTGTGIDANPNP